MLLSKYNTDSLREENGLDGRRRRKIGRRKRKVIMQHTLIYLIKRHKGEKETEGKSETTIMR